MLTKKQHQLLVFIHERMNRDGVAPSFDEMKEALELHSKSGIHRLIMALEERGFLRRLPHRARAVEVVKLPENVPGQLAKFATNVITGNFTGAMAGAPVNTDVPEIVDLPLYGRIAAGHTYRGSARPHGAYRGTRRHAGRWRSLRLDHRRRLDDRCGNLRWRYHRRKRCDTADNGTIVVALVDNEEATLKRLRRKGESIALEPANQSYETRIFGPDRVKVQGRLVGLLRNY